MKVLSLRIESPVTNIPRGQGFYQIEEDLLVVLIGNAESASKPRRFFSYLESSSVRLDIDRMGELLQIESPVSRRQWQVDPKLREPLIVENADIHWLDFRTNIKNPQIITNKQNTVLAFSFYKAGKSSWYRLADSILIQADSGNHLLSIMITKIEDDIAGKKLAAFRGLATFNKNIS